MPQVYCLWDEVCRTYSLYNISCINRLLIVYLGRYRLDSNIKPGLPTDDLQFLDPNLKITIYEHLARMLDLPITSLQFPTSTFNLTNIPNPSGQWMYVTTDVTSGDEIAVDIDSGIQQGNFVRFWQRRIFSIPNEQGARVALFYLAMDCSTGRHRIEKDIYLNSLGIVVAEGLKPGPLQYAMPDTWAGDLFQCVCPLY